MKGTENNYNSTKQRLKEYVSRHGTTQSGGDADIERGVGCIQSVDVMHADFNKKEGRGEISMSNAQVSGGCIASV